VQPVPPLPAAKNLPAPAEELPRTDREWLAEDRRPIGNLTLNIAPTAGDLPIPLENNRKQLPDMPAANVRPEFGSISGGISPLRANLCHNPLYFEEPRVERYGQSLGCIQPVVSAAHFLCNAAILPVKMAVHPPRSFVCQDRYFKRNPFLQEHPVTAGAAGVVQSAVWTCLFLAP
jgi:hypothetical protein